MKISDDEWIKDDICVLPDYGYGQARSFCLQYCFCQGLDKAVVNNVHHQAQRHHPEINHLSLC